VSPEVLRRLEQLDALGGEQPADFNYYAALGEVVKRQSHIENILKIRLFLDKDVQDASHFAELNFPMPDAAPAVKASGKWLNIRFSNFGRMVVVRSDDMKNWEQYLPTLVRYLEDAGYVVMDPEILDEPYLGQRVDSGFPQTWYYRFFYYM
jgi:hypothetical protein